MPEQEVTKIAANSQLVPLWVWVCGAVSGAAGWLARQSLRRFCRIEKRISEVESKPFVTEATCLRHLEEATNVNRLLFEKIDTILMRQADIGAKIARIEGRLDK